MKETDIKNFEEIIKNNIEAVKSRNIDFSVDMDGDESDEVQGNFILDMAYTYSDMNKTTLECLYEALEKIKKGEYGSCEECGEDIGRKRLKAYPTAKYCIGCAEAMEIEIKRNSRYSR